MRGWDPDNQSTVVEHALQDEELQKSLLDQLREGLYIVDQSRRILYWNAGAERITGYYSQHIAGQYNHADLFVPWDSGERTLDDGSPLMEVMLDGRPRESDVFLRHREGHLLAVHVRSRAISDDNGAIVGAVEVFEPPEPPGGPDVSQLHVYDCVDSLTGLANHRYSQMRVVQSLEALNRFGIPFGWLRIELDAGPLLERRNGRGITDAAVKLIGRTVNANAGPFDLPAHWDRGSLRLQVHRGSQPSLARLAEKLALLIHASDLEWWGDERRISVTVAGAMAHPGESIEGLETRVEQAFSDCQAAGGNRALVLPMHDYSGERTN